MTNSSIISSVKFLKKTEWAREKVEIFYLYKFKNLPRVSSEQFEVPPRDRIIPEGQTPGEPAKLSMEDAERLREKNAKKTAERAQSTRQRNHSGKKFTTQRDPKRSNNRDKNTNSDEGKSTKSSRTSILDGVDPWAKWR